MKKAIQFFAFIGAVALGIVLAEMNAVTQSFPIMTIREHAVDPATEMSTIDIDSQTPTNVTATMTGGTLARAFAVEVYNLDTSNFINCGFTTSVSTTSSDSTYGREIAPRTGVYFGVNPNIEPISCLTQNTSADTRATITQLK